MFDALSDRLDGVFRKLRSKGKLSEKDVDEISREIRLALLEADVNVRVVKSFIGRVKAIQIRIRIYDPQLKTTRQVTIVQDM